MVRRDIVVVAASAGGIEALRQVVAGIPADLPAAIAVVVHMGPAGGEALATILGRSGPLPAHVAIDGEPFRHGTIYVCRGDHHLLLADGKPHLDVRRGPREDGHRPSADSLFRSAADAFGPRVIGVVLSGMLDDGSDGLANIRARFGLAVVQDPADAIHPGMPAAALKRAGADYVVAAGEIGALLGELVRCEVPPIDARAAAARADPAGRLADGVAGDVAVVDAIWVALRALEDRIAAQGSLLVRTEAAGMVRTRARLRDDLQRMNRSALVLRQFLELNPSPSEVGGRHDGDRS